MQLNNDMHIEFASRVRMRSYEESDTIHTVYHAP